MYYTIHRHGRSTHTLHTIRFLFRRYTSSRLPSGRRSIVRKTVHVPTYRYIYTCIIIIHNISLFTYIIIYVTLLYYRTAVHARRRRRLVLIDDDDDDGRRNVRKSLSTRQSVLPPKRVRGALSVGDLHEMLFGRLRPQDFVTKKIKKPLQRFELLRFISIRTLHSDNTVFLVSRQCSDTNRKGFQVHGWFQTYSKVWRNKRFRLDYLL